MALTIEPLASIAAGGLIAAVDVCPEGRCAAFATQEGTISCLNPDGGERWSTDIGDRPRGVVIGQAHIFVIFARRGLIQFDPNTGEIVSESTYEGGCLYMTSDEDRSMIVILDGTRRIRILDYRGNETSSASCGETVSLIVDPSGRSIASISEETEVQVLDRSGHSRWVIAPKEDERNRILGATFHSNGDLIVARELLSLSQNPDDENTLEVYSFSEGECVQKYGVSARIHDVLTSGDNIIAGLSSGEVTSINMLTHENEESRIYSGIYPAHGIYELSGAIHVATWFHFLRLDPKSADPSWSIEHTGIIEHVASSLDGRLVILSGNNQDNVGGEHDILLIDPKSEPKMLVENELDDDLILGIDIEDGEEDEVDEDAWMEHLTEDELNADTPTIARDELLADLGDEGSADNENISSEEIDPMSLLESLNTEVEGRNIPPVCDAGDDTEVTAEDDGTAIVVLDGSRSHDPDGQIIYWQWKDDTGRLVGDSSKIKVKLSRGSHVFQLTVTDNDHASTTDQVMVDIV